MRSEGPWPHHGEGIGACSFCTIIVVGTPARRKCCGGRCYYAWDCQLWALLEIFEYLLGKRKVEKEMLLLPQHPAASCLGHLLGQGKPSLETISPNWTLILESCILGEYSPGPLPRWESELSFPMMMWYLVYRKERNKSGISLTGLPLGILRNPVTEMISMTFLMVLTWKRLL